MKLSTESELFKNVKETYRLLRMEERIKIMDYLENRGLTIVRKSGNGGENYTNNGTLPKEYDLSRHLTVIKSHKITMF